METAEDETKYDVIEAHRLDEDQHGTALNEIATFVADVDDSAGTADSNNESKGSVPMVTLECMTTDHAQPIESSEHNKLDESSTSMDTSATVCLTTVTLEDGSTVLVQHHQAQSIQDLQEHEQQQQQQQQHQDIIDGNAGTYVMQECSHKQEETEQQGQDIQIAMPLKFVDGQAIQLEDGTTAYIHSTPREGLHAVQLEDGLTAYIASVQQSEGCYIYEATDFEDPKGDESKLTAAGGRATRTSSSRAVAMGEKAFRCPYNGCGRLYTTQHHLKVHKRSHTGDRPFCCEVTGCNKAFATGYGLKSHTRVHTGEKPYKCPDGMCNKAFKTSGDLQKHVRTHTGEKPFKCQFDGCDRSFTTSNIRKVHFRTHTGERPYTCSQEGCGRSFASATNYKNHIRIHTGEKPYVCAIHGCGKRFTEYSSLYKHHIVHTHNKPYLCTMCGKNYRQASTLTMHRRTIHGIVEESSNQEEVEEQFFTDCEDDHLVDEGMEEGSGDVYQVETGDELEEDVDDPGIFTNLSSLKPSPRKKREKVEQRELMAVTGSSEMASDTTVVVFKTSEPADVDELEQQQLVDPADLVPTASEMLPQIVLLTDQVQFVAFQQLNHQQRLVADIQDSETTPTMPMAIKEEIEAQVKSENASSPSTAEPFST